MPEPTLPPAAPSLPADALVDPLAALRDIHLPPPVPFWPPAPGWWIVAGLLLLGLAVLALLEWRRRRTLAYRAQRELDAIAGDGARYPDAGAVAAAVAVLIRRIVLTRAGRHDGGRSGAAALAGEDWQRFLSGGKAGLPAEVAGFIARAPYLPPAAAAGSGIERPALVAAVRRWIAGNA